MDQHCLCPSFHPFESSALGKVVAGDTDAWLPPSASRKQSSSTLHSVSNSGAKIGDDGNSCISEYDTAERVRTAREGLMYPVRYPSNNPNN
jgi:hypothetical protein